jgi:hypothetical protein
MTLRGRQTLGLTPEVTMTTPIPSSEILVPVDPLVTEAERTALAGFLAATAA